jgi:hypothetical protein
MDKLTQHRKARLQTLIEGAPYHGNQKTFAAKAKLSKGRITQMLDQDESFGERSAKALATRLRLNERYFEDGFAAVENRENPVGATAPFIDRREQPPVLSDDAAYLVHLLAGITDSALEKRLAHACVALVLREIAGPGTATSQAPSLDAGTLSEKSPTRPSRQRA